MSSATLEHLQLQYEIDQLNAAYGAALDEKRFSDWPEFFVEDGRYILQARENFDHGLPLALMDLESRGMMKDRVYGITQTIYHAPYYTRHVISPARVLADSDEVCRCQRGLQRRPLCR
jgi:salicylate 5-hydroxylase small subunit